MGEISFYESAYLMQECGDNVIDEHISEKSSIRNILFYSPIIEIYVKFQEDEEISKLHHFRTIFEC